MSETPGTLVPEAGLKKFARFTPEEREEWLRKYPDDRCAHCHEHSGDTLKQCGNCRAARYCSEECQRTHWSRHGPLCMSPHAPHSDEAHAHKHSETSVEGEYDSTATHRHKHSLHAHRHKHAGAVDDDTDRIGGPYDAGYRAGATDEWKYGEPGYMYNDYYGTRPSGLLGGLHYIFGNWGRTY